MKKRKKDEERGAPTNEELARCLARLKNTRRVPQDDEQQRPTYPYLAWVNPNPPVPTTTGHQKS